MKLKDWFKWKIKNNKVVVMIQGDWRANHVIWTTPAGKMNDFGAYETYMTPREFEFFVTINYFELKTMSDEQLGVDTNYIMKDGMIYSQYLGFNWRI